MCLNLCAHVWVCVCVVAAAAVVGQAAVVKRKWIVATIVHSSLNEAAGPSRYPSCLPVLYVMCGQVSFSSHVFRAPRGLITLPTLFIWREEEKRRGKMKDGVCDRLFPVAQPFKRPGLLSGLHFKTTLQVSKCVWGKRRKLLMEIHLISARSLLVVI